MRVRVLIRIIITQGAPVSLSGGCLVLVWPPGVWPGVMSYLLTRGCVTRESCDKCHAEWQVWWGSDLVTCVTWEPETVTGWRAVVAACTGDWGGDCPMSGAGPAHPGRGWAPALQWPSQLLAPTWELSVVTARSSHSHNSASSSSWSF